MLLRKSIQKNEVIFSIEIDKKFYMNKLLKFGYYNILLGLITWLELFPYKINYPE